MKYIRTTKGIWEIEKLTKEDYEWLQTGKNEQADTIPELCDELVIKYKNKEKPRYIDMTELLKACKDVGITFREHIEWLFNKYKDRLEICNLAIWTDWGLKYVAKMNEKGESELC